MLKKIEITVLIFSLIVSYGVFLAVIYTDFLDSYAKIFGVTLSVTYMNVVGIYIWSKIF